MPSRRPSARRRRPAAPSDPAAAPARASRTGRRWSGSSRRTPSLGGARLGLPGELERARAVETALPVARREIRRWPVLGQIAGLDHLRVPLVGLAPQEVGGVGEVAGLVEDEEGRRVEVVEAGAGGDEARPDLGGIAGGERAALPRDPLRPSPRRRRSARGPARGGRGGARPSVRGVGGSPRRRRPGAGTRSRAGGRPRERPRYCVGRWGRRRAWSRSRRRTARCGWAAAPTAGRRRRCRRVARTRRGPPPRSPGSSRARGAPRGARREPMRWPARSVRISAGRSSGASVAWTSAWTLATRTFALPARHWREGGDASRGLVGHELAALVGERGPRLQHGDEVRVAEPRAQLLRNPVADLRVPRDPADALRVRREGEGRGQVRLRAVRDRRQPDVLAVLAGLDAGVGRGARAGCRTRRCRGGAAAGRRGPGLGGLRHGTMTRHDPRAWPRPPASVWPPSRPSRRRLTGAWPPDRAARPRRRPTPSRGRAPCR